MVCVGERVSDLLEALPERGWGVLRCSLPAVLVLHGAGWVKVEITPHRDVWQARLTGAGRTARSRMRDDSSA